MATNDVPAAIVLSVQGRVEIQRAGVSTWEKARTNLTLQLKDRLRTGPRSRATLQLPNLSIQRIDELSNIEIQRDDKASAGYQVELKEGGLYFFNREKPIEQRFRTPVASGAILGTEFVLRVASSGETQLLLLDGSVELTSDSGGSLTLGSGEAGSVMQGSPPQKAARLDSIAAVQWCLYYPAILDPGELGLAVDPATPLALSLSRYLQGDLLGALEAFPEGEMPTDPNERIYLAALVLAVGQVTQAETLLGESSLEAAMAVRGLIAAVRGSRAPAGLGGSRASVLLANSYLSQAAGDLEGALRLAIQATQRASGLGYAWVRRAELEFSFGRLDRAGESLDRALSLAPRNAQALALRGFILAGQNRLTEALSSFELAMAMDGGLANAWLGRGLCRIRQGQVHAGRADLQVAAGTEPNRAVLRSYLAKAWSETDQDLLVWKELRRAQELDPGDPTSWLYAALLEQQRNRINPAIDDLEKSQALNQNRSVYRSRLLLDQDRAVRSANLAGVYRDAGMTERSVREASRAVADDYANASAHRFLADSYFALRDPRKFNLRYETPWLSELLVAQLLAPVGGGSLSQYVSQNEYSKLFERDRLQFRSSTEYTSVGTWHEIASQFGTFGNMSYALDVDYRSEAGFYPNSDTRQLSLYGKIQQQFSPSDTGFLLINHNDYESGDMRQYYDPYNTRTGASQGFRSTERHEPNAFLGWHHEWAPGQHTLLLAGRLDAALEFSDTNGVIPVVSRPSPGAAETGFLTRVFDVDYRRDMEAWTAELQHLATLRAHSVVGGVRFQSGDLLTVATQRLHNGPTQFPGPNVFPNIGQRVESNLQRFSAYFYDTWRVVESVQVTAGVSYDRLDYPQNIDFLPLDAREIGTDQVSPKLGLMWSPWQETHFRAAWTRSLGGLFYDTSLRLEPVQVAGFNQAWRSLIPESVSGLTPGSAFETIGLGMDQKFTTRTYLSLSAERLTSDSDQQFGAFDWARSGRLVADPVMMSRELTFEEHTVTATVNQLMGDHWAVGAFYRVSEAELESRYLGLVSGIANNPDGTTRATMHQMGTQARFFLNCGFFAELHALWTQQSNGGYAPDLAGDDFWQLNLFAGHRFFNRRAELRVGVLNLGDQDYRLNPLNLHEEYPRERTFYAGLRLFF